MAATENKGSDGIIEVRSDRFKGHNSYNYETHTTTHDVRTQNDTRKKMNIYDAKLFDMWYDASVTPFGINNNVLAYKIRKGMENNLNTSYLMTLMNYSMWMKQKVIQSLTSSRDLDISDVNKRILVTYASPYVRKYILGDPVSTYYISNVSVHLNDTTFKSFWNITNGQDHLTKLKRINVGGFVYLETQTNKGKKIPGGPKPKEYTKMWILIPSYIPNKFYNICKMMINSKDGTNVAGFTVGYQGHDTRVDGKDMKWIQANVNKKCRAQIMDYGNLGEDVQQFHEYKDIADIKSSQSVKVWAASIALTIYTNHEKKLQVPTRNLWINADVTNFIMEFPRNDVPPPLECKKANPGESMDLGESVNLMKSSHKFMKYTADVDDQVATIEDVTRVLETHQDYNDSFDLIDPAIDYDDNGKLVMVTSVHKTFLSEAGAVRMRYTYPNDSNHNVKVYSDPSRVDSKRRSGNRGGQTKRKKKKNPRNRQNRMRGAPQNTNEYGRPIVNQGGNDEGNNGGGRGGGNNNQRSNQQSGNQQDPNMQGGGGWNNQNPSGGNGGNGGNPNNPNNPNNNNGNRGDNWDNMGGSPSNNGGNWNNRNNNGNNWNNQNGGGDPNWSNWNDRNNGGGPNGGNNNGSPMNQSGPYTNQSGPSMNQPGPNQSNMAPNQNNMAPDQNNMGPNMNNMNNMAPNQNNMAPNAKPTGKKKRKKRKKTSADKAKDQVQSNPHVDDQEEEKSIDSSSPDDATVNTPQANQGDEEKQDQHTEVTEPEGAEEDGDEEEKDSERPQQSPQHGDNNGDDNVNNFNDPIEP